MKWSPVQDGVMNKMRGNFVVTLIRCMQQFEQKRPITKCDGSHLGWKMPNVPRMTNCLDVVVGMLLIVFVVDGLDFGG